MKTGDIMKILYLAHRIPYPPNKGDKIRSFNEIRYLSARHEIHLACLSDNKKDLDYQKDLYKYCKTVKVVSIDQRVSKLKAAACLFTRMPLSIPYFYSRKLQRHIDTLLAARRFDVIFCFSSPMAEYILNRSTNDLINHSTKTIMDFCDVDSEKWLQYSQQSEFPLNLIYRTENRRLLKFEKKINKSFDNSVFVSQQEADLFYRLFPEAKNISVIGNGVDHEYFSPESRTLNPELRQLNKAQSSKLKTPCSATSPILLFTGAMNYWANVDGVLWFCEKILPIIKAGYPEVQFYIAGSDPKAEIQELERNKGIKVTGFVEDIRPCYKAADICVIPLRLARGIQNKVLEAMSMGKAVVTTSNAVQSIMATPGVHLLVEDDVNKFAEAVSTLLGNHSLRNYLGENARQFVKSNYNWQKNMKKLENLLPC